MSLPETNGDKIAIIRETIDGGRLAPTQILVIAISLILNMLDGFDVTAMAFTAHSIGEQLDIPPDQLGIVFSSALIGMMIGAMFIAPYSDIVGRRRMILLNAIVIGISMCATGYADNLWHLIVLRLVTGLGVGGMLACLATITSEFTPTKYRSFAVVTITAGYPVGAMLGGFLAASIIPAYGWQSVFFVAGAASLVMSVVVFFFLPESLQFLGTRRPKNALQRFNDVLIRLGRQKIDVLPDTSGKRARTSATVVALLSEGRRGKTITLWMTFFFCFICLYFLVSWIPKLVINAGLTETQGVYASVAFNAGAVVGILLLGWLSSRIGLSKLISIFLSGAALTMILFAIANGIDNLLLYLGLIGFLLQGGFVGLYAVAARIYPAEVRTTGVGWAIGLGRFGAVVGPYLGGLLIAGGTSMSVSFVIFAVPLMISGVIAYRLKIA